MEFGASLDIQDAESLTPRVLFVNMGPEVTAAIQKWLRKRAGEEAPRQNKQCDGCQQADVPLKNCSRCKIARYCSVECQRNAWPSHKINCRGFSESMTVTVKPVYNGGFGGGSVAGLFSTSDFLRQATGIIPPQAAPTERKMKAIDYPKDVVIKVQTPLGGPGADMLVYTKKKDLLCQVRRGNNPKAFDSLERVVKYKGVSGLKAYFSATLKNENELVVQISDVLAEQPF